MTSRNAVKLVVNADDFGCSPGVNRGILECIASGTVTSVSVMANRLYAAEAKKLTSLGVSIGLHLDMTHGGHRKWLDLAWLFIMPSSRIKAIFYGQVQQFSTIVGQPPDHIDGHHLVHLHPRVKPVVLEYARKHDIPVRHSTKAKFIGTFFGGSGIGVHVVDRLSVKHLVEVLAKLAPGTYELMCHPGYADSELESSGMAYLRQRELELETLTSKGFKEYLKNTKTIKLSTWQQIN